MHGASILTLHSVALALIALMQQEDCQRSRSGKRFFCYLISQCWGPGRTTVSLPAKSRVLWYVQQL